MFDVEKWSEINTQRSQKLHALGIGLCADGSRREGKFTSRYIQNDKKSYSLGSSSPDLELSHIVSMYLLIHLMMQNPDNSSFSLPSSRSVAILHLS